MRLVAGISDSHQRVERQFALHVEEPLLRVLIGLLGRLDVNAHCSGTRHGGGGELHRRKSVLQNQERIDPIYRGKAVLDEVGRLVYPARGLRTVGIVLRVNEAEAGAQHSLVGKAIGDAQARSKVLVVLNAAAITTVFRANLRQASGSANCAVIQQEIRDASVGERRSEEDVVPKADVERQGRGVFRAVWS